MNPLFLWNNKLSLPRGSIKNCISPDLTNEYYIDSNPTGATATISAKNGEFPDFDRNDTNTNYVDIDNGSDTTGTGTWANPYKTIGKALQFFTNIKYQIGIKSDSYNHESSTRNIYMPLDGTLLRIFGVGGKRVIIQSGSLVFFYNYQSSHITSPYPQTEFYNIYFSVNPVSPLQEQWFLWDYDPYYRNYYNFYFCQEWQMENFTTGINYNYIPEALFSMADRNHNSDLYFCFFNSYCSYTRFAGWLGGTSDRLRILKNNIFTQGRFSGISEPAHPEYNNVFHNMEIYHNALTEPPKANIYFNCIYSGAYNSGSYCCNNNVLLSGTGNIKANPLFINIDPLLPEDFQLQIQGLGYIINSPCFRTGNALQNEDIGAWQFAEDFSLSEYVPTEEYKKYLLEHNPKNLFMST